MTKIAVEVDDPGGRNQGGQMFGASDLTDSDLTLSGSLMCN
jgi:hypothetical protein